MDYLTNLTNFTTFELNDIIEKQTGYYFNPILKYYHSDSQYNNILIIFYHWIHYFMEIYFV